MRCWILVNNEYTRVSLCLLPCYPNSFSNLEANSLEKCSLLGSFLDLELLGLPEPLSGSDHISKRSGKLATIGLGQGRSPNFPHSDCSGILCVMGDPLNVLLWMETSRMSHRTREHVTRGGLWNAGEDYEDRSNFGDRKDEGNCRGLLALYFWPYLGLHWLETIWVQHLEKPNCEAEKHRK